MPENPVSKRLKSILFSIVSEMAEEPALFAVHPGKDFTRNRSLGFERLLHTIIGMRGNSINKELYDVFKERDSIPTASAFVQQREKLLPSALYHIFREFNRKCYDTKTYKGWHLFAIDGSDVNIAKNPESDTYVYNGPAEGYNQFHVNALFDLLNKTYYDCLIQPRPAANERAAAIQMVEDAGFAPKTIVIADRGYEGHCLFEHMERAGVKYLVRVKNSGIKEIARLPLMPLDKNISIELRTTQTNEDMKAFAEGRAKWISGPSKRGKEKKEVAWDLESPCRVSFRVVRFMITEETYETVVTNLDRDEFSPSVIKELYHLRWGIETSFRELKYAIGLTNFHAKKEDSILQEIYARLVMYNFCMRVTLSVTVFNNKDNIHAYQVNYTMAIQICVDFYRFESEKAPPPEKSIAKYVLPVRPGRHDKRKLVPKTAVFFIYRVA